MLRPLGGGPVRVYTLLFTSVHTVLKGWPGRRIPGAGGLLGGFPGTSTVSSSWGVWLCALLLVLGFCSSLPPCFSRQETDDQEDWSYRSILSGAALRGICACETLPTPLPGDPRCPAIGSAKLLLWRTGNGTDTLSSAHFIKKTFFFLLLSYT